MSEKSAINYIFFLKSSEALPSVFFQMSQLFSQLNITLLPVTLDDLQNIDRHKKHQIIICRNDLLSATAFLEIKKSYLDFAMARSHVSVYDISSFSEMENAAKFQTKKSYMYFPLPIDLKQVVMAVTIDYFNSRNEKEEWPGGRRSKIPTVPETAAIKYENKNQ
jgi:hypothetical protein